MKTTNRFLPIALIAGFALTGSMRAATIFVDEFSFEGAKTLGGWTGGGAGPGQSTNSVPSPWVKTGIGFGSGWTTTTEYPGGIPNGDIYAYANGGTDIRQTLAQTLQANTTYTLTIATGWRADLPGVGFPTYPGYRIELFAGTTQLAFDATVARGGTGTGPAGGTFKDVTATFTSPSSVTAGQALEIRLIGYDVQTNYDNVRLDGTLVPEPSTAMLIGLGGLALLRRRRNTKVL